MWITKTIFVGSDGNRTIEINESTSKEWAEINKVRQIARWHKIIKYGSEDVYGEPVTKITIDEIKSILDLKNKNKLENKIDNSFSVEVYESNHNSV